MLVALLAGFAAAPSAHAGQRSPLAPCEWEASNAGSEASGLVLPNRNPLEVDAAMSLFRFNRKHDALVKLDAALRLLRGPWRWRIGPDDRKDVTAAITAFRNCIAAAQPPAMATLSVRTLGLDPDRPYERRIARAGVRIEIEDVSVGRTGSDGTLTLPVPSGRIQVTAEQPPTSWTEDEITIAPLGSATISLLLDDEKEVAEDDELVLAEAVDDIIPAAATSFTLRFVRNGRPSPVARVEMIDLVDRYDNGERDLSSLFTVTGGAIAAKSTKAIFDALAGHLEETIALNVEAVDAAGLTHANRVRFRVGRSRLLVTLAPPPSNPSLPVSNIEVGVSLVGAGIAVQRTSDAAGRFEVQSFPRGSIALDCATTIDGVYYYGQATMTLSGARSVTLVLRNVKDIVNGVPALR